MMMQRLPYKARRCLKKLHARACRRQNAIHR